MGIYIFLPTKQPKRQPVCYLVDAPDSELATLRAWRTWGTGISFYSSLGTLRENVEANNGTLELKI